MELPNDQENKSYVVLPLSSCGLFEHNYNEVDTVSKNFVCSPCFINRHIFTRDDCRGPSSAQLCNTIILCIISFEFFTDECKVFLDSYLA